MTGSACSLGHDLLERGHGGGALRPRLHQLGQSLERFRVVSGHGGNRPDRRAAHFRRIGFVQERFDFGMECAAKPGVMNQGNGEKQIREAGGSRFNRLPGLERGAVRRRQCGVTDLAAQRQLRFTGQPLEIRAPGVQIAGFVLQQDCGEIRQDRLRFLAFLIEFLQALDQFGHRITIADFGKTLQRLETIPPIDPFAFEQGDVNEFAPRGLDQFLVG